MEYFFLGFAASLLTIILAAELYGNRKRKSDPVSKSQECIELYQSTGNLEMLREARKQLEMAIYRIELKEKARQDRESNRAHEKL